MTDVSPRNSIKERKVDAPVSQMNLLIFFVLKLENVFFFSILDLEKDFLQFT